MTLVAIRHLITPWNRAGRLQGRADIPIEPPSEDLRLLVAENRRRLDGFGPFDAVCCSTRQRTVQTAGEYGYKEPLIEPLLDEYDFGVFEGRQRDELISSLGHQWLQAPQELVLGEKMTDIEQRVRRFVAKYQEHRRVLVFGHGCWLRVLLSLKHHGDISRTNQIAIGDNEILVLELPSRATGEKP